MKKILLFAFAVMAFVNTYAQKDAVQNYIQTYKELAINEMIRSGVPASITLAQGILETQAGQSDLVQRSNNHFGIKCKTEWEGDKVYHDDDAKGECFRSYSSPEESYKDHSDFLKYRPHYAFLFKLDPTDYEGWAKGLKKAGYATSSTYAQLLIKIIVTNRLQDYTLVALQRKQQRERDLFAHNSTPTPTSVQSTEVANETVSKVQEPPKPVVERKTETVAKVAQTLVSAPSYPSGLFEINHTKVLYSPAGTSLFALASNHNIPYKKLLEFNELTEKDILDKDQLIFLAKKPKKGANEIHIVTAGETLIDIAQKEGIRLENLIAYNKISKDAQPEAGETLYLQSQAPLKSSLGR